MKTDLRGTGKLRYRWPAAAARTGISTLAKMGMPNLRYVSPRTANLVHSSQHLVAGGSPWIVDMEDVSVLFWHRHRLLRNERARRRVLSWLERPDCRRILPWTDAARKGLVGCFGEARLERKIEVLYPAIRAQTEPPTRRSTGAVRLLFVGAYFYAKGGLELARAFKKVGSQYDVTLTLVTQLPDEARREVASIGGITVRTRIPDRELRREFALADLFVLPAHSDTFEFVFLEAFARRIPVVSTDIFSIPEIVEHGSTGLLIPAENNFFGADWLPRYDPVHGEDHPLVQYLKEPTDDHVDRLTEAIARLVDDPQLRDEMGQAAWTVVQSGRFSCSRRARQLARVYQAAMARETA